MKPFNDPLRMRSLVICPLNMSEAAASPVTNGSDEPTDSKSKSVSIREQAENVLQTLLRKHEDLTVMIASREGRVLTSTLNKNLALEQSGCILNFTDKAKVLVRKLLSEELSFVRIRGIKNEIVVTFDETNSLEIITIQEDNLNSK